MNLNIMKNFILATLILTFTIQLSAYSQYREHMTFMNAFWKQIDEETIEISNQLILQEDSKTLIVQMEKHIIERDRIENEYIQLSNELTDQFERNYKNPEKSSTYRDLNRLEDEIDGLVKNYNRGKINLALAETSYNLCLNNNPYNPANCNNLARNYNNILNNVNDIAYRHDVKQTTYNRLFDEYDDMVDDYNRGYKKYENEYNSLKTKYTSLYDIEADKVQAIFEKLKRIIQQM